MGNSLDSEELMLNACIVLGLFTSWADFGDGEDLRRS